MTAPPAPGSTELLRAHLGFVRVLRAAGVPADPSRGRAFLAALAELGASGEPAGPVQTYWAGRLTLCAEPDDMPRYDAVFQTFICAARPPEAAGLSVS